MINSYNSAILFGALEFVQPIFSQFVLICLATLTTLKISFKASNSCSNSANFPWNYCGKIRWKIISFSYEVCYLGKDIQTTCSLIIDIALDLTRIMRQPVALLPAKLHCFWIRFSEYNPLYITLSQKPFPYP